MTRMEKWSNNLIDALDEKHETYKKIWKSLSWKEKLLISGLVVVGILMTLVGGAMILS